MSKELINSTYLSRLKTLADRGIVKSFDKGSRLIDEGDQGSTIFIVLSGRLKAFSKSNDEKRREVTYGVYGVGDIVGEMSLDGGPRSASVTALETSTCSVVTKETVKRFVGEEPDFAFDLLSRLIARARRATLSARNMVLTDAYGRLTELLVGEANSMSDGTMALPVKMSHREIASRIGCSRGMVSRLMKDLETGDYISLDSRKRLVIRKSLPPRW